MVDNEKQENLANARRKLKKFRDQQQPTAVESNGPSIEPIITDTITPQNFPQTNGIDQHVSKSPIPNTLEPIRPENQRVSSSVNSEQKLRRDNEHLQEQLEVHVQTIGILVAEKTDISAKLSQSFKQLERKQSEMDELYGRLKASRERVQELEKQMQNSTSNVQKREMAAKESDKENDRLKIENIRQSQLIEDFKQNITELNEKLRDRQNNLDQLNNEVSQLRTQPQSSQESSTTKEQMNELQQTLTQKTHQFEELVSSVNRMRSDNEQYQESNSNMQVHIQELTSQINQLTKRNQVLQENQMKLSDQSSVLEYDHLQQENQLFRNAIEQWSNRYEDLRVKLEQMTRSSAEKDEQITELQATIDQQFDSLSNDNANLNNQLQTLEEMNRRLNEQLHSKANREEETVEISSNTNTTLHQELLERYNQITNENTELKNRTQELEHVILQLQSETDTIGDYIRLYQQQREQLQKRQQEKDDSIKQLAEERMDLQKKLSELQILLIHGLNIPSSSESNLSETGNQSMGLVTNSIVLSEVNDASKARLWSLINELGQNHSISSNMETSSLVKRAFVEQISYLCSTCSGSVQCV